MKNPKLQSNFRIWPTKKLGDYIEESGQRIYPKNFPNREFEILGVDNKDGVFLNEIKKGNEIKQFYKIVQGGELVYNPYRINVGSIGIVPQNLDGRIISNAYVVFKCKDKLLAKYLLPILKTEEYKAIIDGTGLGSIRNTLSFNLLCKIKIPVFLLPIQRKIVERLDAIKKAQELNEKQIELSEELFQSLFYRETSKGEGKWQKIKLEEVCIFNPSKREIEKFSDDLEVTFLAMEDVSTDGEILNMRTRKLSAVKKGYTYFKEKDILFAKITPCMENGKGALAKKLKNKIGFGSTEFHIIRTDNKKLLNKYLFNITIDKKFRMKAKNFMTGTAGQQRLPINYLKGFRILLPSLETQQKIVEKLSAVQDYKKKLLDQKQKLQELFESCLNKSMKEKSTS